MGNAFSPADAQEFVNNQSDLRIKGDLGHTLQNYLNTHQPPQGVIVNPALGVDVLVWFDAGNKLHVIENVDPQFASSVAMPDYHTADESFWNDLVDRTIEVTEKAGDYVAKIPNAIPDPDKIVNTLVAVGIGVVVLMVLTRR